MVRKIVKIVQHSLFLTSIFAFPFLMALDLSPWYPTEFEFQSRASYLFQHYRSVAASHGSYKRMSNDHFLQLDLGVPYYDWYLEGELICADTHHRNFHWDCCRLMGRYQLMDDVDGADPFSLIISAVLTVDPTSALRDISSFHHGKFEGFFSVSMGKEFPCNADWRWRIWGEASLGLADIGSPWLAGSLNASYNSFYKHVYGVFLNGLCGFGTESLSADKQFHGYGPIKHRSIDAGLVYRYEFENESKLTLGCSRRIFAKNFPNQAVVLFVTYLYPFSL